MTHQVSDRKVIGRSRVGFIWYKIVRSRNPDKVGIKFDDEVAKRLTERGIDLSPLDDIGSKPARKAVLKVLRRILN